MDELTVQVEDEMVENFSMCKIQVFCNFEGYVYKVGSAWHSMKAAAWRDIWCPQGEGQGGHIAKLRLFSCYVL